MNSLPVQNSTSTSQPIAPIDRGLSNAVASIMNTVEKVDGQAVATRLPTPELRKSIIGRLADVRTALAPLRGIAEKDRAARALVDMLRGWFNAKSDDPRAKVAGYITILQDLPCWVVEQVCQNVAAGRVEGLDRAYPPSAAQLHVLCEEALERLRKEQSDLLMASTVKLAAEPVPTEAERLRIGTKMVDLRDELEHGNADDVEARLLVKREQNNAELARQQSRVAAEYAAAGMAPPSPLALSLTARRDMQERGILPADAYQEAE
jgi:hypothetical protein